MRSVVRGFCSVLLAVLCSGMISGSASASWYWPWGSDSATTQATPVAEAPSLHQATPATTASTGSKSLMHPSTWSAPSMPWASSTAAKTATPPPAKNAWTKPQSTNTSPSPWQSVKNGTRHVENATAGAWHKTVGVFTPGSDAPKQQVAATAPVESHWWNRMWGPSEPEKSAGPRTVGEFMAQKRLEP